MTKNWKWKCTRCGHEMETNLQFCPICRYTVFSPIKESSMLLCFEYINWRDEAHVYVIEPESISFDLTAKDTEGVEREARWLLHGMVVTRDGDPRPDMNPRRRSFILVNMNDVSEMPRSE